MNTTENSQIEVSETSETSERFTVELHPAAALIDGAEHCELASELVLAAELSDEESDIALEAIAISPEGMELNARAWETLADIRREVAPKLRAIQSAREQLFRGYDERLPRIIAIQSN